MSAIPPQRCSCCACNNKYCLIPHKGHDHRTEPDYIEDYLTRLTTKKETASEEKQD